MLPEQRVVKLLKEAASKRGGFLKKMTFERQSGCPDYFCFLPNGRLLIIEVKAPNGKLKADQQKWIEIFQKHGFKAGVYWGGDADLFIEELLK